MSAADGPPGTIGQRGRGGPGSPDAARLEATIRGVVQGVGYRWATASRAETLGIAGYVRNRDDGAVELVAEGPRENLEALVAWCRQGPRGARVSDVQSAWGVARGEFAEFQIRR